MECGGPYGEPECGISWEQLEATCSHAVVMRRDVGDEACHWYETGGCVRPSPGASPGQTSPGQEWSIDKRDGMVQKRIAVVAARMRVKLEGPAWHSG